MSRTEDERLMVGTGRPEGRAPAGVRRESDDCDAELIVRTRGSGTEEDEEDEGAAAAPRPAAEEEDDGVA